MSETTTDEQVMVIPTADVHALFKGRDWVDAHEIMAWIATGTFVDRGPAEKNLARKQIINYVILRSGDRVYSYARGKAGGEARLHAMRSIGIGGHVNQDDAGETLAGTIRRAAYREFVEEIELVGRNVVRANRTVGLINDDSDEVGRVHLGVVHVYELDSMDIKPREACLVDGRWVTLRELRSTPNLETWSAITIQHLFPEGGIL